MSDRKYKVALYCRVASADQLSLDTQCNRLSSYAIGQGFESDTLQVYADNGFSGLNFDRPAFSQMEQDIKAGIIGAVIVRDISRIGRNSFDVLGWVKQLRDQHIAFVSWEMPFSENYLSNRGCFKKLIDERYRV